MTIFKPKLKKRLPFIGGQLIPKNSQEKQIPSDALPDGPTPLGGVVRSRGDPTQCETLGCGVALGKRPPGSFEWSRVF